MAAAADVATFVRAFSGAPAGKRAHDFLAARSSHNDAHAADRAKYIALNTKLRELKVAAIKATKQHAATLKKQKAGNAVRMWSIGDIEQGFEAMLKNVLQAACSRYHGGTYEGNALRRIFWGFERRGERFSWRNIVEYLKGVRGRVSEDRRSVFDDLVSRLARLCEHLETASKFMLSPDVSPPAATATAGEAACKAYVEEWRAAVTSKTFSTYLNRGWTVKLKHHLLESHSTEVIRKWGCLGIFSEASIESLHRYFNVLDRMFAPIASTEKRWCALTDRILLNQESEIEAAGVLARKVAEGKIKKHRKM